MENPLKILIVDDEVLVRSDLIYLINNSKWRGCIIREEEDGEAALACLDVFMPDIVITDIRMPKLNGIELMKEIRRRGNKIHLIVVSGYSDFDYATKALRYGAMDYLLKPIDDAYFYNLMRRVEKEIRGSRAQGAGAGENWTPAQNTWLINAARRVMSGSPLDLEEDGAWRGYLLGDMIYCIGTIQLSASAEADVEAAARSVHRAVQELLGRVVAMRDNRFIAVTYESFENILIMIGYGDKRESEKMKALFAHNLCRIAESADTSGYAAHVAGPAAVSLFQLEPAIRRQLDSTMDRFRDAARCESDDASVIVAASLEQAQAHCVATLRQLLRVQAYSALLKDVGRTLGHLFYSDEMAAAGLVEMQSVFARMEKLIASLCIGGATQVGRDGARPVPHLSLFHDMRGAVAYLVEMVAQRESDGGAAHEIQSLMWSVKSYLDEHYAEPVTLTDTAERFGVNANYLSTMFRHIVGTGFVEHITHRRIESAKRLLRETDVSAAAITELTGFSSPSYFQRVFKAKVGMTPKRYRQIGRGR